MGLDGKQVREGSRTAARSSMTPLKQKTLEWATHPVHRDDPQKAKSPLRERACGCKALVALTGIEPVF